MKPSRVPALLIALMLALVACSGDSGSTTTTTKAPPDTTEVPPKTLPSGAVDSLEGVRGAIIRIVAEGSFADPEFGQQYNAAGSGSGFFINSDGIAVTNNHVVTGAAFLEVYVEGEEEPRNARVLGVSECSDLAVIDVEGDGYPYLEWYEGDLTVGTQIYAAGFPLGNEEYTLLDGIISKENADGESDWASVDSVIEHSADTLPGNSGGPIVTENGKVVAVNYAGDSLGQAFGIGRDEALEVIPTLVEGEDVTSIGINGQALVDGDFYGIWVASVASGSPADLGGIRSGDLVTMVEGLIPATDGTMADYCDILRSNAPGDPLGIEIYRPADDAFLEGTLNTDKVLALSFSFESTLQDDVIEVTGDDPSPTSGYDSYDYISDINNTIRVEVPTEWSDRNLEDLWTYGDVPIGASIAAAIDRQAWIDGWQTPGMFFGASAALPETVESMLDAEDFSAFCTYDGRTDYSDEYYEGAYDLWVDCDGADTLFVVLAAEPPGSSVLMLLEIVVVSDADLEALDRILASFVVDEAALSELSGAAPEVNANYGIYDFIELVDGDCFTPVSESFDELAYSSPVEWMDCANSHEGEVYAWTTAPDAGSSSYPGVEELTEGAMDFCVAEFEPYTGSALDGSDLTSWYFYPTETGWAETPYFMCVLRDGEGVPLVGSAYQSGW